MPVRPEGMPKAAQEKLPDFDAQLDDLTQQLEKSLRTGLERDELHTIVSRIFEHSISDGLSVATRLRFTPRDFLDTVMSSQVAAKHDQVARLTDELSLRHGKDGPFEEWAMDHPIVTDKEKEFVQKIDAIFAPLLATREFSFKSNEKAQETGDVIAERFLTKVKRAYEHHYYTGPVKRVLERDYPDVLLKWGDSFLQDDTVSQLSLQGICVEERINCTALLARLKDARYLLPDGVIQIEQKLAEKPLIENLKKLVEPDREVILNADTGKYEIKEVEGKEKELEEKVKEKKKEEPSRFESLERLRELLDGGAKPEVILYSLTGLDTDAAWEWREYLYGYNYIGADQFIESMNGLDSERARKWRDDLHGFGAIDGVDAPDAWDLRKELFARGDMFILAGSLVGLDSAQAWEFRDRLHKEGVRSSLMESLAGLDSKRAWDLREQLQKEVPIVDIALSLVGVDSPRAWEWRDKQFMNQGESTCLRSMTGLDSERAREKRRWFLKSDTPPVNFLAKSLLALDSDYDRYVRNTLENMGASKHAIAEGLIGVDQPEAWQGREAFRKGDEIENDFVIVAMILKNQKARQEKSKPTEEKEKTEDEELDELEKRLAEGGDPYNILELTAGMDSERSWDLRSGCMAKGADSESYAKSLAFVNSDHAWSMRQNPRIKGFPYDKLMSVTGLDDARATNVRNQTRQPIELYSEVLAESFMGVDNPESWNARATLLTVAGRMIEGEKKRALLDGLALSVTGFDTQDASDFRIKLLKQGADEAVVSRSEAEKPLAAYKRLRRESHKRRSDVTANDPDIQNLLHDLNTIHHPTPKSIDDYLSKHPRKTGDKLPPNVLTRLSQTIQDAPQAFLKTIAAKRDRNPEMLAQQLFEKIYPDTVKPKKEIGLTTRIASFFGFKERPTLQNHESFLTPHSTTPLEGGGEALNDDLRKVVEFRNEVPGLLVNSVYGGYNKESGMWQTAEFPLADTLGDPTRQTTGKIEGVKKLNRVRLPKPLSAKVVTERVKGVLPNGTEVPLEVRTDYLGMATVVNDKGADQILYSIEYDIAPTPMRDVTAKEYQSYLKRFETAHGKTMREQLPGLSEDVVSHIQTPEFKALPPKEQVTEIERYVRAIGYYDTKNEETIPTKQGKALGDKFFLAEMRAEELRSSGQPGLEGKKFSGVCADYAGITCALLRKAGFPSGVVEGLQIEGKQALMRDSHSTAYVVWPTQAHENQIVIVDGTPSSAQPEFAYAAGPTIEEREQIAHKEVEQAVNQAKTELKEISEVLKSKDAQAIKKLSNGKLERALNTILHHEVTDSHTDILKEMLNVYWYGGLKRMEGIQSDLELRKTMEAILDTHRRTRGEGATTKRTEAGTELFEAMQDFIRKYKRSEGASDSNQALDALEHIGDIAKDSLQPTERQALDVIVTYLRAKKVG